MSEFKPTIALVDPYTGGHHDYYLRLFQNKFLELGCQVIVLCAEPERVRVDNLEQFIHKLELRDWFPVSHRFMKLRRVINAIGYWRDVACF